MKLLINTATTHKGGSVQVAQSFLYECIAFSQHEYHVILGLMLAKTINKNDFPSNFFFYEIEYRPATRVFSLKDPGAFFKKLQSKIKFDCVITTSGPAYWRPNCPHVMGFNLAHYLYKDSPFFKNITMYRRLRWFLKSIIIKHYTKRDADRYVVQTDDINTRLQNWITDKNVYTVTNTYGKYFDNVPAINGNFLPPRIAEEKRFLLLSAYYTNKNFEIINDICEELQKKKINNIYFILTLPHDTYSNIFTDLAKKYIHNLGPVNPTDCPSLYQECDFVFLPTLLECFSATYAEGMKMRKPIVTTDLGFAHTVCADAAIYYAPLNAGDAADKILKLANDKQMQLTLIENGEKRLGVFTSAKERARKYLEICQQAIDEVGKIEK